MKVGIDIGGSHISIGIVNENGQIIEKNEKDIIGEEKNNFIKIIESYIPENLNNLQEKYKIENIGIAFPGSINNNIITKAVNLKIQNYNIVQFLENKINLPIKIKNDAKCAALAEHTYGSLKNYKNAVFLTLGTGIGGAIIANNELLETSNFPGFEFGHMIIEKNGKLCKCGKHGCFEAYAAMKVFKDNLRENLKLDKNTRGKNLLEIIKKDYDNPIIQKVINEYIENLSIGISNLINIFEPEAISIGGSFIYFEEILLPKIKNKLLNSQLLFNKREKINIIPATLGNSAGIIGATLI